MSLAFAVFAISSPAAELARSSWLHAGPHGRLVYQTTAAGDRILDFSHAGYMGGGVALPDVPVVETVHPSGAGDDTAAIQAAIDRVASLPLKDGFRGTVLLGPGTFSCAETITIAASGIVLRGGGSGAAAETGATTASTTIKLTGQPHLALAVRAERGAADADDVAATRSTITDAYVPSGATAFNVADASGFAVGDRIAIRRPVTEAWIEFMRMHDLTRNDRPQTWIRPGSVHSIERVITVIDRSRITLDAPVPDSFDAKYLNPPGVTVAKLGPTTRVTRVGIEHLHIESPPQEISHNERHFTALRLNGEDCWVRDVVIDETMDSITTNGRRITLERVSVRRKAKHQGASKPMEFAPNASQVLVDRCAVVGDNVWFIGTGAGVPGPIVMLNCTFLGRGGAAESHQRWSTAVLYDNCRVPDGGIELRSRGAMGSGHGWTVGWGVVWNCVAAHYIVQDPPGTRNWLIGSIGSIEVSPRPFDSSPLLDGGTVDSPGRPVAPRSLYLAQLAERLGPQALRNIGYASSDPTSALIENTAVPRAAANAPRAPRSANLAADRPVLASNTRGGRREFAPWQALDDNDDTSWQTDDDVKEANLELDTEGAIRINRLELGEARGLVGRVQSFKVEGFVDSAWQVLAVGTTIGELKTMRIPTITVWKLKLTVHQPDGHAAIRHLGAFLDAEDARPRS